MIFRLANHVQQIDQQTVFQMSQRSKEDRMSFTFIVTFQLPKYSNQNHRVLVIVSIVCTSSNAIALLKNEILISVQPVCSCKKSTFLFCEDCKLAASLSFFRGFGPRFCVQYTKTINRTEEQQNADYFYPSEWK